MASPPTVPAGGRLVLVDAVGFTPPRLMMVPREARLPPGVHEVTPVVAVAGPRGRPVRGVNAVAGGLLTSISAVDVTSVHGNGGCPSRAGARTVGAGTTAGEQWYGLPVMSVGRAACARPVAAVGGAGADGAGALHRLGNSGLPAAVLGGRRLAVVTAAAGFGCAETTAGEQLYGFPATSIGPPTCARPGAAAGGAATDGAGVLHRLGKSGLPAGVLGGRRLAVVAAAAAAPEGGDGPPSDLEGVASSFRMEMQMAFLSQRPMICLAPANNMKAVLFAAEKSIPLITYLLAKIPVNDDDYKDMVRVGKALVSVVGQGKEGYLRADTLAEAALGLKRAVEVFFPNAVPIHEDDAPPPVPASSDNVDKHTFFQQLMASFLICHGVVLWEAQNPYGF
ncbi:hypothetical protein ACP70R_010860 [Stipagrostis hirtigluma subsp. patula]